MISNMRPNNQEEREQARQAAIALREKIHDERVINYYDQEFLPVLNSINECRESYVTHQGRVKEVTRILQEAETKVSKAARIWAYSLVDDNGCLRLKELKPILGVSFGTFLQRPASVKVERSRDLFLHLERRTDLRGDPESLAAYKSAIDSLDQANNDYLLAQRELSARTKDQSSASDSFVIAYNNLRQAVKLFMGPEVHNRAFPRFNRSSKSGSKASKKATEQLVQQASAPKSDI